MPSHGKCPSFVYEAWTFSLSRVQGVVHAWLACRHIRCYCVGLRLLYYMISERQQGKDRRPLEARLATYLRLPGMTYAREYYTSYPNDYIEPEIQKMLRRRLGNFALSAAQRGELPEQLGLDFIASKLLAESVLARTIAYHGSPYKLDLLQPQQAAWNAASPNKRYRFADGDPAICASPTTDFPAMRAVLHGAHPEIASQPLILRKRVDRFGRVLWFTSEETLDIVTAEQTSGNVYAIDVHPEHSNDTADPVFDALRNEYRIFGTRQPLVYVPVTAESLPDDLCVIPTDSRAQLATIPQYDNVVKWSEEMKVDIRPLGGLWPKEYADY